MIEEIFKDIPGYEGLYQVSNLGNVKSLERIIIREKKGNYIVKENILKPRINDNGYYCVNVYKEGYRKNIAVHILVAIAFLGHVQNRTTKIIPDHKDRDKSNNNLSNLELITQRENIDRYWSTIKTSSKYTGVSWNKIANKWMAKIYIDGKQKHLGYFTDEYQAHLAYQKALNKL